MKFKIGTVVEIDGCGHGTIIEPSPQDRLHPWADCGPMGERTVFVAWESGITTWVSVDNLREV